MKSIETEFMGYRFRSRLEARWAVVFQSMGLDWRYEFDGVELGGGLRYLPDFQIGPDRVFGHFVEIKGAAPTPSEIKKMGRLTSGLPAYGVILFGGLDKDAPCLMFHKDEDPVYADVGAALSVLGDTPWPLILAGLKAGKMARFEFGETPK